MLSFDRHKNTGTRLMVLIPAIPSSRTEADFVPEPGSSETIPSHLGGFLILAAWRTLRNYRFLFFIFVIPSSRTEADFCKVSYLQLRRILESDRATGK